MMRPATVLLLGQLMVSLMVAAAGIRPPVKTTDRTIEQKLQDAGEAVASWSPCLGVYPWELGTLTESDLLERNGSKHRIMTTQEELKWDNKTLPYHIERTDFTKEQQKYIKEVLDELESLRCIVTKQARPTDRGFVRITGKKQGCYTDHWGMKGGEQRVNLQPPACLQKGTVYHLLFHALGFWHLHNNPIRDDYIKINFDNVAYGKEYYLMKYEDDGSLTDFEFRYDYGSVMHASRKAYSGNGQDTIITHDPLVQIGQRVKPSYFDIQKLRKLYGCEYYPEIKGRT